LSVWFLDKFRLLPASGGEVRYLGLSLQRVAPYEVVQRGISHAPEGRKGFSALTVQENLTLGAFTRRRMTREVSEARKRVFGLFPVLGDRRHRLAGTLSGGEQQMLALACRGYVLETGRVSAEGSSAELLSDTRIRQAYLGDAALDSPGSREADIH
jgi:ABC-type branched-subunit amino acid transport system ATPase component